MIRAATGIITRLFVLAGFVTIVGHAAWTAQSNGQTFWAIVAVVAAPVTLFVWPLLAYGDGTTIGGWPLWSVLVTTFVAYPISTFIGGLPSVDRPSALFDPDTWVPEQIAARAYARDARRLELIDQTGREIVDRDVAKAAERYYERAALDDPVGADTKNALEAMRVWLGEHGSEDGGELDPHSANSLYTLATRAYLWRLAENGPIELARDDLRAAVERARLDARERLPGGAAHRLSLFHAAARCVVDEVPVWHGSPGGLIYGWEVYMIAFETVTADFPERGFRISENTQRLAFRFGICLADVERHLARTDRQEGGQSAH